MTAVPAPGRSFLRPASLSATALQTAQLCMARFNAEHVIKTRGFGFNAASLGSAVHGALEMYVVATQLKGNKENATLSFLLDMFKLSFCSVFNTSEPEGEAYNDGVEMLTEWHKRMDWTGITVLSVETKTSFELTNKKHGVTIPFNYIFDRLDQLGPAADKVYRVVDYKTNRWGLRPDDLDKKIQARVYGLVAQMMFPDAERIWVQFDLLRHERVGRVFSREQNIATWKMIHATFQEILETPEDEILETLNPECNFCVRKASCDAYLRNVSAGGIYSLGDDMSEVVDRRAMLEWQRKAIESAITEMDAMILLHGKKIDVTEFESENNRINFKVSNRRNVAPELVEMVIGPDKFSEYGGKKLTMAQFDVLMKDPALTPAQKAQLKSLVLNKTGEPTVAVSARSAFGDD